MGQPLSPAPVHLSVRQELGDCLCCADSLPVILHSKASLYLCLVSLAVSAPALCLYSITQQLPTHPRTPPNTENGSMGGQRCLPLHSVLSRSELRPHLHLTVLSLHFIKSVPHPRYIYLHLIFHPVLYYLYLSGCSDLRQLSQIPNSFSSVNIKFILHSFFFFFFGLESGSFQSVCDFSSLFISQLAPVIYFSHL